MLKDYVPMKIMTNFGTLKNGQNLQDQTLFMMHIRDWEQNHKVTQFSILKIHQEDIFMDMLLGGVQ